MPNPPIVAAENMDWTYEDFAEELEHLALVEDLEPPAGPTLADLPSWVFDDEFRRIAGELEIVAELEAR